VPGLRTWYSVFATRLQAHTEVIGQILYSVLRTGKRQGVNKMLLQFDQPHQPGLDHPMDQDRAPYSVHIALLKGSKISIKLSLITK
jgi:hypothetical protein